MRGIVSLAIALGLPHDLADGSRFPFRDSLIFILVAVVIFTLLGQGLSLQWLVKRLGLNKSEQKNLESLTEDKRIEEY